MIKNSNEVTLGPKYSTKSVSLVNFVTLVAELGNTTNPHFVTLLPVF